eukprot:snap_masked-scaffold_81-processed-gene-0.41-mRNA-1 protein AED:1.00 eAED:1.00 QI:0/0/0/0/1/1/2/0/734
MPTNLVDNQDVSEKTSASTQTRSKGNKVEFSSAEEALEYYKENILPKEKSLKAIFSKNNVGDLEEKECSKEIKLLKLELKNTLINSPQLPSRMYSKLQDSLWICCFYKPLSIYKKNLCTSSDNCVKKAIQKRYIEIINNSVYFYKEFRSKIENLLEGDFTTGNNSLFPDQSEDYEKEKKTEKYNLKRSLYHSSICLGDLIRYKITFAKESVRNKEIQGAESWYRNALEVFSDEGHPINQQAALKLIEEQYVSAASFYLRASKGFIKNGYGSAANNLKLLYQKFNLHFDILQNSVESEKFFTSFMILHSFIALENTESQMINDLFQEKQIFSLLKLKRLSLSFVISFAVLTIGSFESLRVKSFDKKVDLKTIPVLCSFTFELILTFLKVAFIGKRKRDKSVLVTVGLIFDYFSTLKIKSHENKLFQEIRNSFKIFLRKFEKSQLEKNIKLSAKEAGFLEVCLPEEVELKFFVPLVEVFSANDKLIDEKIKSFDCYRARKIAKHLENFRSLFHNPSSPKKKKFEKDEENPFALTFSDDVFSDDEVLLDPSSPLAKGPKEKITILQSPRNKEVIKNVKKTPNKIQSKKNSPKKKPSPKQKKNTFGAGFLTGYSSGDLRTDPAPLLSSQYSSWSNDPPAFLSSPTSVSRGGSKLNPNAKPFVLNHPPGFQSTAISSPRSLSSDLDLNLNSDSLLNVPDFPRVESIEKELDGSIEKLLNTRPRLDVQMNMFSTNFDAHK